MSAHWASVSGRRLATIAGSRWRVKSDADAVLHNYSNAASVSMAARSASAASELIERSA